MRRVGQDWRGALGIVTLMASLAGTAPACAAADLLYGGQVSGAGMPVTRDGGNDPGGLPGSAPLAAQSGKLDPQQIHAGLRLSDVLAVEATRQRPFGEATRSGDQALSLAGKATLPLTDALSVTGRLGVQYSGAILSASGPELADSSGRSPVYGLGLTYEPTEGLELRIESEHVATRSGDPRTVTGDRILLGARFRF